MDDEELVAAYYACSNEAFTTLYERHYPRLLNYLHRFVQEADAHNLAEEAFFRLVRTKATGHGRFEAARGTFRNWLGRIAHNALSDFWAQQGHQPELAGSGLEEAATAPPAEEGWEEAAPDLAEAVEHLTGPVGEGIALLPEQLRAVLLLTAMGYTLTEIGQRLGIAYGTAGNHLRLVPG
jgi:RNA polymerase sigma factor (sigma-70 family)